MAALQGLAFALAYRGEVAAARTAAEEAGETAADYGDFILGLLAEAELAAGDLAAARRWIDDAVGSTSGWHHVVSRITRARVAMAQDQPDQASRDAHAALAVAVEIGAAAGFPEIFECLAALAGDRRESARLHGAAASMRGHVGAVRFQVHQADYGASVAALREAMGETDFDAAWAEGAGLSVEEAIAYAQRGHGERKRPASGWGSLTPAEREVVKLVCEGLGNKDVATRLFVSPRTVQAHLTHIYTKLGLSSRIQLIQEAGRQV